MQLRTEKPNITAKNYLTVGPGEYPCGNNLCVPKTLNPGVVVVKSAKEGG